MAGITVAIVALPLAIGFGITSGATASAGIATAILAGFIVSIVGGSKFQISGPTGAMTVVLVPIIQKFGISIIPAVGIMAGILLILFSAAKLGNLINKVPQEVIEGFTGGIAIVIALQQMPLAFDVAKGSGNRTLTVAWSTFINILNNPIKWQTISILILTLIIKFGLVKFIESIGFKSYIPASFIAILFSTTVVQIFSINVVRIGNIPRNVFRLENIDFGKVYLLAIPALSIALLAAIESLLSARVADDLANASTLKPNRELLGQGLGTLAASIFGGLPATGAIARTNVNVRSNAQSKWAGVIHAIVILLVILFLAPLFAKIPAPAIAGVLIGTSFRIFNRATIKEIFVLGKDKIFIYLITAFTTVAIDLIWAIAIGTACHLVLAKFNRKVG